jgi:hypothetical protein
MGLFVTDDVLMRLSLIFQNELLNEGLDKIEELGRLRILHFQEKCKGNEKVHSFWIRQLR